MKMFKLMCFTLVASATSLVAANNNNNNNNNDNGSGNGNRGVEMNNSKNNDNHNNGNSGRGVEQSDNNYHRNAKDDNNYQRNVNDDNRYQRNVNDDNDYQRNDNHNKGWGSSEDNDRRHDGKGGRWDNRGQGYAKGYGFGCGRGCGCGCGDRGYYASYDQGYGYGGCGNGSCGCDNGYGYGYGYRSGHHHHRHGNFRHAVNNYGQNHRDFAYRDNSLAAVQERLNRAEQQAQAQADQNQNQFQNRRGNSIAMNDDSAVEAKGNTDEAVAAKVRDALKSDDTLSPTVRAIDVVVRNGKVVLVGIVTSEGEKRKVEIITRKVVGVIDVENNLKANNQ